LIIILQFVLEGFCKFYKSSGKFKKVDLTLSSREYDHIGAESNWLHYSIGNNTVAYSSGAFLVLDYRHGFDALPVSRIKGTFKLFFNFNIFSKS